MRRVVKILGAWMIASAWACSNAVPASGGQCTRDGDHTAHCGGMTDAKDYASYSCTGSARPDGDPKYVEGVPEGIVCADQGEREDGVQGYCCTTRKTSCAYNPVAICDDEGTFGYQCRGANRPDALNAALSCGNVVEQGQLVNYCCSGKSRQAGCLQSDSAGCPSRLMGFSCRGDNLPRGEQLGANKSRSDFYRLLCSAPTPAANPDYKNYCCYAPAPLPPGGSCIGHSEVPGCDAGRFGFACYGPETPEDDYLPMRCPDPGKTGVSAEGYPATLYCCDFH